MRSQQEISDHLEITQLLYRYAVAIDTRELDRLASVFTPDAWIQYNVTAGKSGEYPEMVKWLGTSLVIFKRTQHVMTNALIDLDGDAATSLTYLQAAHVQERKDGVDHYVLLHATYSDEHVRTPEGWRIRRRVLDALHATGEFLGPDQIRLFS